MFKVPAVPGVVLTPISVAVVADKWNLVYSNVVVNYWDCGFPIGQFGLTGSPVFYIVLPGYLLCNNVTNVSTMYFSFEK